MLVHEQVTLPNGVEVDGAIADLLTAMWDLGLRTTHSCQGTPGSGEERDRSATYISFPQAEDAYEFFSQALRTISTPQSMAQVVVTVRLLTKIGMPGWETRKRGPVVSLELGVTPGAEERNLRGCVRFDQELMAQIEAAYAAPQVSRREPHGGPTVSLARERLLAVLGEPNASSAVRAYFAETGTAASSYAGRLFEQFGGGGDREDSADALTADDLIAVESLSVRVPPEAAYALLHGSVGDQLESLLSKIPLDVDLGSPGAHKRITKGSPADRAWTLLETQPGIGWVTAGKLLARKRPRLLPVYDDVVRCVLGAPKDVWLALDDALADPKLQRLVAELRPVAPERVSALRVVDVAVWMRHHKAHGRGECAEFGGE